MQKARVLLFLNLFIILILIPVFADIRIGGGGATGEGTDPVHFKDETLMYTPVPTATPIVKVTGTEIRAWENIRETRHLILRCRTDLRRYENFMREGFMDNVNKMGDVISKIHTYAAVYKRDQIEYAWENAMKKTRHTLALCEEFLSEFREDYDSIVKNQRKTRKILDSPQKKKLIQRPWEMEKEYELAKEDMFFVKKKIDYFAKLYRQYEKRYEAVIEMKNKKIAKLLREHRELHRP